jgi:predicted transcriptional regulator
MGRKPTLKPRARAVARKQLALQRVAQGISMAKISEEFQVTPQRIRQYLAEALETQSIYHAALTPEKVQELRSIEMERMMMLWKNVQTTITCLRSRFGSKAEKSLDAMAMTRMTEAGIKLSERGAN